MHINRVKQALKQGKSAYGCSSLIFRSPEVMRALAAAGLDWAFLDAEHGAFDLETLNDMMRVAVREGFCPIVRVADLQYPLIARALDSGAQGILLPRVESPELLAQAISWTRYPPLGVRGYGLGRAPRIRIGLHARRHRALQRARDGRPPIEPRERSNAWTTSWPCRTSTPCSSVPRICPSRSGFPASSIAEFVKTVEFIRDKCDARGIAPGLHLRSPAMARRWRNQGLRFLSCNNDLGYLLEKATEVAGVLKGQID